MITIETKIEVSTLALGDVAITAAEGGIGHWSQILTYEPSRWDNVEVADDFVFYTIAFEDPNLDRIQRAAITPQLLARGIGLLMSVVPILDISAMDALDADLAVQYGVFGELVFS